MSEHSPVKKRSVRISGLPTSVTVEEPFWQGLKETDINKQREHGNLSSVIRLYVLDHYRRLADAKRNAGAKR